MNQEMKKWIRAIAPSAQDSDCITPSTTSPNSTSTIGSSPTTFTSSSTTTTSNAICDCGPGTTCLKNKTCGKCAPDKDNECPSGTSCLKTTKTCGKCTPDKDECPSGTSCLKTTKTCGKCTPGKDDECPGTTCLKNNTCGICKTNEDCKEHEVCLSAMLVPGNATNGKCGPCREDGDCEPWQSCVSNREHRQSQFDQQPSCIKSKLTILRSNYICESCNYLKSYCIDSFYVCYDSSSISPIFCNKMSEIETKLFKMTKVVPNNHLEAN